MKITIPSRCGELPLDDAGDFGRMYYEWPSDALSVPLGELEAWMRAASEICSRAEDVIAERDKRIDELEERIADLEAELAGARSGA